MDDNGQILYKVLSGLGGNDPDLQNNEGDSATPLSQLCRICALPNEYLIPIFEGEGQENNLADKIHSHLPIRVSTIDDYPDQVCYQCASTLLAFHDLVDCCKQANITLTSRVQLGQSKKTFTKISTQAKNIDASQTNKERYSLSFRSNRRAQRGCKVLASPLAADPLDVKVEPECIIENPSNFFMDDSSFPSDDFKYPTDDGDAMPNLCHSEVDLKLECGQTGTRYLVLHQVIAKLKEHVAKCHKPDIKLIKKRSIYDTETKDELEKAKVRVEGKIKYQCNICNKYYPVANKLLNHRITHSEKSVSCEYCSSKFSFVGYLKTHMKRIHSMDINRSSMEYEPSVPKSEPSNNQIQSVRSGSRQCKDYKALENVKVVIDGEVFYQCEMCDKKLSKMNQYFNHLNVHTGHKGFVCHLCGKSYHSNGALITHLRLTHEDIRNFICDICQKKFRTKVILIEHLRIHSGERPHVCTTCGKRFKQMSALYIHNRTHTDYFPFQCVQCDSKFRIQSQLNYHMARHTGNTPYICTVCGKTFPIKYELHYHMRTHTDERPFPCQECGKTFRHKKNAKTHLKNCHKIDTF